MAFDYVVVGGGAGGGALAARLTEDPAVSVLLLEAGPEHRSADLPPELAAIDVGQPYEAICKAGDKSAAKLSCGGECVDITCADFTNADLTDSDLRLLAELSCCV